MARRKFIVVVPDGTEVKLGLGYLTQTFKHGTAVYDEIGVALATEFPQYFKEVPQAVKEKAEKVKEPNVDELLEKLESLQKKPKSPKVKTEAPKKGRPAGKFPKTTK